MALALTDYHKKCSNLRTQILKNEEQRILLEQKIRSLSNVDTKLKQQQQIDHIQSYFQQLNQESQRSEQRNLNLLNDITQAERNLDQLRIDSERLIRLKNEYQQYLESTYPKWQKSNIDEMHAYNFDRETQNKRNENNHNGSHAMNTTTTNNNNNHMKDSQYDEHSLSESSSNAFSRSKPTGSLRMELYRSGLTFLLDFIEQELIDTIDKTKFYRHDPPTIAQKRSILDIANSQQQSAVKDLDPATVSMVVLDQLPSTIRRTTVKQCLFNEDILSSNIIDLDRDLIAKMLSEQDRSLWTRLIDHFVRLLKYHIMNAQTLANIFAPTLLPSNSFYLYEKAKSLLKHIVEKHASTQNLNSDDETSSDQGRIFKDVPIKSLTAPGSFMNKLISNVDFDDSSSSSSTRTPIQKTPKSVNSPTAATPKTDPQDYDSDFEFYN